MSDCDKRGWYVWDIDLIPTLIMPHVEILIHRADGVIRHGHVQVCEDYTRVQFGGTSKAAELWSKDPKFKFTHWRFQVQRPINSKHTTKQ